METAVFLARRHRNVSLELSGIPPKKLLEYLPRLEELSDKCVWGTDFPSPGVVSMKKNVDDFLALPISESASKTITGARIGIWYRRYASAIGSGRSAAINRPGPVSISNGNAWRENGSGRPFPGGE